MLTKKNQNIIFFFMGHEQPVLTIMTQFQKKEILRFTYFYEHSVHC